MARYPRAAWRPAGTPGGPINPTTVILHSEATLGHAAPHSGLEWHFWVGYSGAVEQLVDTERRADANNEANPFAISIETEDDGDPDTRPWTGAQVDALVDLVDWCCRTHGIARRQAPTWNGGGIGYHTLFGAPSPWTPVVKTCPGRERIKQFPPILARVVALGAPSEPPAPAPSPLLEDDMPIEILAPGDEATFALAGRTAILFTTDGFPGTVDPPPLGVTARVVIGPNWRAPGFANPNGEVLASTPLVFFPGNGRATTEPLLAGDEVVVVQHLGREKVPLTVEVR
jgi:hypothetical protein